jgi:predicted metal-dependent peptidase
VTSPAADSLLLETALPVMDRRSSVLTALGVPVLLRTAPTSAVRRLPLSERLDIYVDVSGSMDQIKGPLYGAVQDSTRWVTPRIHLFSTEVSTISPRQLREGYCQSTSGTDIACVLRHMKEHQVRKALIVTDGYVGTPDRRGASVLAKVDLAVAYTRDHYRGDLGRYCRHSVVLDI